MAGSKSGRSRHDGPSRLLKARVISALVLGIAALVLTWLGGFYFRALVAAGSAAVFYEWTMLVRAQERRPALLLAGAFLAVILVTLVIGASAQQLWLLLAGATILSATMAVLWWGLPAWAAGGMVYAALPALSLALLRDVGGAGLTAILYVFAVVWATDILAYFVGRRIGGPKLAPSISPGKTWSGAIGGTLAGTLAGIIVVLVAGRGDALWLGALAVLLSIVSQIGDLFESHLKRRFGAKDSGRMMPGHGGFMDRVDGLVAAALVLYVVGSLSDGIETPAALLFAPAAR